MSRAEPPVRWGGHIGPEHARAQAAMDRAAAAPPEPDPAAAHIARRLRAVHDEQTAPAQDRPAQQRVPTGDDQPLRSADPAAAEDRPQIDTAPARRWTTDRW